MVSSPLSTSPETGSGQADILISQAESLALVFISFHLPSPNSKGPLFPIRKLGTTSKGWELYAKKTTRPAAPSAGLRLNYDCQEAIRRMRIKSGRERGL